MNESKKLVASRREFLKTTAVAGAALAAPAVLSSGLRAQGRSDTLRVGLIGCGGRGTGAAGQALAADPNAVLTAVADVFPEKIEASLSALQREAAEKGFSKRIDVPPARRFVGLDAYKAVIGSGVDVVLLATPPGFRPAHLKAAVEAGKHIFTEKPMATDVPGVRTVMEAVKLSKEKKLSVVSGFCWRYEAGRRELFRKIHEGAVGQIRAIYATFYTGPVKRMPPPSERPPGMGDVEWQLRNWYNFVWLSGDGYVEQACHSVDKMAWALQDASPLKAVAVGGRQTPNNEGNIYDHMFVVYEFDQGVRGFLGQRQISNCYNENADYIMGSDGIAQIGRGLFIRGKVNWRYQGPKNDMYQQEHDELFASIRAGKAHNDGDWMTHSTLMAIMGRMAAYTGQEVSWEDALNSQEKLVPDSLRWDMELPIAPMAIPGITKLI